MPDFNNNYGARPNDLPPFSQAFNNPPPTSNGQWNSGNQYTPAAAPAPSYGQSYTPQTQAPQGNNRLGGIFSGNQGQAQGAQFSPVMPADPRYTNLANDLARLKGLTVDAGKAADYAQKAEQADAGQNLIDPFLGDGLGGQMLGAGLNVGTAAVSHILTAKANKLIKQTKELEQQICYSLKTQFPEFANVVTRGKSHDRLGSHKAIFQVGTWLDTANDLLCGGGCFDATSWWLVHRIGTVEDGLRELKGNIESLERTISSQAPGQQANGQYGYTANQYNQYNGAAYNQGANQASNQGSYTPYNNNNNYNNGYY